MMPPHQENPISASASSNELFNSKPSHPDVIGRQRFIQLDRMQGKKDNALAQKIGG